MIYCIVRRSDAAITSVNDGMSVMFDKRGARSTNGIISR
jgi:hypothetical protein